MSAEMTAIIFLTFSRIISIKFEAFGLLEQGTNTIVVISRLFKLFFMTSNLYGVWELFSCFSYPFNDSFTYIINVI